MPIDYTIDPELHVVREAWTAAVTAADLRAHLLRLLSDPIASAPVAARRSSRATALGPVRSCPRRRGRRSALDVMRPGGEPRASDV